MYAAVGRLVTVGMIGIEAIRIAVEPHISSLLARDDRDGAQELFRVGTWWLVAISWPLYVVLAMFAPVVLTVFGGEFVEAQHALTVVALAMLVSVGTGNVTVMLLMGGKSVWNMINTSLALVTNVVLNLILIPRYGMVGAALAWTATIAVENFTALFQVRRLLGITPFGGGFVYVTVTALGVYGGLGLLIRHLFGATTLGLIVYLVVATAVYMGLLYRARTLLHFGVLREVVGGFAQGLRRGRLNGRAPEDPA
jgi:O-antigen/teichoic acid export membrane protein